MKKIYFIGIFSLCFLFFSCEQNNTPQNSTPGVVNQPIKSSTKVKPPENLVKALKAVEPFFQLMSKPKPDEWLANFKEDGQTFEQYINSSPILPTADRKILYIQPLGKFDQNQMKIIEMTAEYMRVFFNLPVKPLKEKALAKQLSLKNHRVDKFSKITQIRTRFILDEVLQPELPADAAALIAFTNEDLYPEDDVRYVFGQVNIETRVGVWSLFRLQKFADFEQFLTRTLKIAVHEIGHLFSIKHCTKYECVMSGTNHLAETYKRPIDACPECMAKICWMTGYEPQKRYEHLAEFSKKSGLKKESDEFTRKKIAVNNN
jgi:archaemetzincin